MSSQEYAKAALILIARVQYAAFLDKFGREPGVHDPLFFDKSKESPVKADHPNACRQILEVAGALGVEAAPVLAFLGLDQLPQEQLPSNQNEARETGDRPGNPHRKPLSDSPLWTAFLADRALHRREKITSEELQILSGTSFLGNVTKIDEILFVLNVIRHSQRTS